MSKNKSEYLKSKICITCNNLIISGNDFKMIKEHMEQGHVLIDDNRNATEVLRDATTSISKTSKINVERKTRKKVKGWVDGYFVESVLVDGKPKFLCNFANEVCVKDNIETEDEIIKPLEAKDCGFIPYSFTSSEILDLTSSQISKEEVLEDVKGQIDRYLSMRELDKHLVLGDLFLTYCQEWIATVHYPWFVGETESGKSSVLHLLKWLGYRTLLGEDTPQADVYNFLGSDEEGCGTIAEDEAQDLWKNPEKVRMYKSSYSKGSVKARIVGTESLGKHQVFYKTFCPKWFAGERVPLDKGFLERLAVVHMSEGQPQSNIKRLTDEEKSKLNQLRNRLLVWKVQNISKGIDRIDSGLKQRDQELWEDFLCVVSGTKYFEKCKNVSTFYIEKRHETIKNSFEAKILKLLVDKTDSNFELNAIDFWQYVTNDNQELPGRLENETFYPDDFNRFSKNTLSRLLEDKFQAVKRTRYDKDDSKYRKITFYSFKAEILQTLVKKYGVELPLYCPLYSGLSGTSGQTTHEPLDHLDNLDHLIEEGST